MAKDILIHQIQKKGSLPLYEYIQQCMIHPQYGYYTAKKASKGISTTGDFITAPEISQLFGEIIGVWGVLHIEQLPVKNILNIIELGPGKGTLIQDMLRVLKPTHQPYAIHLHFVDVHEDVQDMVTWPENIYVHSHKDLNFMMGLRDPFLLIANEFFDALPIDQYRCIEGQWEKAHVRWDAEKGFYPEFAKVSAVPKEIETSFKHSDSIQEHAPDLKPLITHLCRALDRLKGVCICIDYGYDKGVGDTLQGVYKHAYHSVYDKPGEVDISAHVNFGEIMKIADHHHIHCRFDTQGEFLNHYGLQLRAMQLIHKNSELQEIITNQVARLTSPQQMGQLFKVIELCNL